MSTIMMILMSLLFGKNETIVKQENKLNAKAMYSQALYDEGRKGKVAVQ